jgi:hypothetical protein
MATRTVQMFPLYYIISTSFIFKIIGVVNFLNYPFVLLNFKHIIYFIIIYFITKKSET